ncbi:uncharacterized protein LOC129599380 [Paramacrobiotus metropolitanus]|uniref:uncharacterized protein LOC129599380 n=1 Tax=Paramacrobiotus metropolitanus TaxID=2943436 RepID=UPI002445BCC5|nr:uncharacterized protein LOC129599380 [Paramacrobiotus metropolitanus]
MRVAGDTVTAICAEIQGGIAGRWIFWDAEALMKSCRMYLRAQLIWGTYNSSVGGCGMGVFQDEEETTINNLVPPILACILLSLDVSTQFCTSRVCALWRLILREYNAKRHVVFDVSQICVKRHWEKALTPVGFDYLSIYKLVATLDRNITSQTRSVALIDEGRYYDNPNDFFLKLILIDDILTAKGLKLPLFIAKNGYDCVHRSCTSFLYLQWNGAENYSCCTVEWLMRVCQHLVLLNYTASDRKGDESHVNMFRTAFDSPWPEFDAEIVRYKSDAQLNVVIPVLRFRSTEAAAERRQRFLATVNKHCPVVSQQVYEKVAAAHARWVETLVYPDEWSDIRRFLQLFSDPPEAQQWEEVDLKELDVATLSRLALHLLDGYYKD